jgi:hypothetical protein
VLQRYGLSLGVLLSGSATASPLTVNRGRLIQANSCSAKASARCWTRTATLSRFAGEAEAELPALEIDLRLAWEDTALLVRTKGLSPTQHIEVVVSSDGTDDLATAQLVVAKKGITSHPLVPAPTPGQTRAVRVLLRDTNDGSTRSWAPEADGDLSRSSTLWFTASPLQVPNLQVDSTKGKWRITAPAEADLSVTHRRPILPKGGRGISPPWSVSPPADTAFDAPPHTGWYDIVAKSGSGDAALYSAGSVYWTARPGARLSTLGIHPAPKSVEHVTGEAFTLQAGATICATDPSMATAASWLGTELNRLTGYQPEQSCAGEPDITLGLAAEPLSHSEGYTIQAREGGIQIQAMGRHGARYAAIATADLVGIDGQAEPADIKDWPTIDTRVLYHEVSPLSGPMVSSEQTLEFIDRVVARSRINMLILELKGGYQSAVHPEISRAKGAWSRAELEAVIERARSHGIEVIPALNTPAHARWIGTAHPELLEEETAVLLCTRHPDTRTLVEDLYNELIEIFDQPRFVHIGHDEIGWRTHRKHESQRCVRCQGTPRWQLLAEDLVWHHKTLAALGAKPMLWSDMLVEGWNGKQDGIYRATNRIPEAIRSDFWVMSWSRIGDTIGTLTPKGYTVIRGNTGYADWKRVGLNALAAGVAGEALALFNPTPWSSFEGIAGDTRLYHHWSNVILAGATAWEPRIEDTPIDTALLSLMHLPSYRPGYKAWPRPYKIKPFVARTEPAMRHNLDLPEYFQIDEIRYASAILTRLRPSQTEMYTIRRKITGLSIVHGVSYAPGTQPVLAKAHKKTPHQAGVSVAEMVVTYHDKQVITVPLILGMNTNRMDAPIRGSLLFDGSAAYRLPSKAAGALARDAVDRALYRFDWHNPRPDAKLASVEIKASHPDVNVLIAGMAMAVKPANRKDDDL